MSITRHYRSTAEHTTDRYQTNSSDDCKMVSEGGSGEWTDLETDSGHFVLISRNETQTLVNIRVQTNVDKFCCFTHN